MAVGHFLLLGLNGAGLSTALDAFADFGFLTIAGADAGQLQNAIPALLQGETPVAVSVKLRPDTDGPALKAEIEALKRQFPALKVLCLDAPSEVLIQRYLQSDKHHAFEAGGYGGLQPAIAAEFKLYESLKGLKDYHIDTSTTTASELRHKIARILGLPVESQDFTVYITTFGFKYGIPKDAELMFDMRFMTNPFYDEALRPMTGRDKPVRDFIFNLPHARPFFEKWAGLIAEMLPHYQAQGKTRLTVAVGCTGGKHRSVCMAEELARYLRENHPAVQVVITHREMLKWGTPPDSPSSPACSVGETSSAC